MRRPVFKVTRASYCCCDLYPLMSQTCIFFLILDIIFQKSVSSLLLQSISIIDDLSIRDGFIGSKYRRLGSQ